MTRYLKYAFTILLCLIMAGAFGQSEQKRKQLEEEKRKLIEDIEYKNKLLEQTKKEKESGMNELVLTEKKITERERLIMNIQTEVNLLGDEILDNEARIESMEKELQELKDEYAQMIRFAYKNRSNYDMLMFVFSAEDFNQAYKRLKYFREYSAYRRRQAEMIKGIEQELIEENEKLEEQRTYKQNLLATKNEEKIKLAGERKQQEDVLEKLKKKEKKLAEEIKQSEKERATLNKAIERIIAEEIRKASAADEAAEGSPDWRLTPDAKILAENFTGNKGKLPWPTTKGVITETYGIKPHAVVKHLKVKNDGVTITTEQGEDAQAVFDGEVSKVIVIPGAGKAIIIRHGDYITAYKNLDDIYVKTGDRVKAKQKIGKIKTRRGKTELEFQIRKGQNAETLNPAYWLYKAN